MALLRSTVDHLRGVRFVQHHTAFLCALAESPFSAGRAAQGLVAVNEALTQSERNQELWCVAESLRLKGELVLLEGWPDSARIAEDLFRNGLDWARRQEALSWELRIATSMARFRRSHGSRADARDLLASVYGRFREGFGTADLRTAKTLLDELMCARSPAGAR